MSFPTNEEQIQKILRSVVPISSLDSGENPAAIVSVKIVNTLPKEQEVPLCFLVVDHKYNFSVISIYNTNKTL